MISLETSVTGGQIARALLNDPEEMAYCLAELATEKATGFAEEVAEFVMSDIGSIVTTLRELADALEKEALADGS